MPEDSQLSLLEFVKDDIMRLSWLLLLCAVVSQVLLAQVWFGLILALLLFLLGQTHSLYVLYR